MKKLKFKIGGVILISIVFLLMSCDHGDSVQNPPEVLDASSIETNRFWDKLPISFSKSLVNNSRLNLQASCSACKWINVTAVCEGVYPKSKMVYSTTMSLAFDLAYDDLENGKSNCDVTVTAQKKDGVEFRNYRLIDTLVDNFDVKISPLNITLKSIYEAIAKDDAFIQKNFTNKYWFYVTSKTDIRKVEIYENHRKVKTEYAYGVRSKNIIYQYDARGRIPGEKNTLSVVAYDSNGVTGLKEINIVPKVKLTSSELAPIYNRAWKNATSSIYTRLPSGCTIPNPQNHEGYVRERAFSIMACSSFMEGIYSRCNGVDVDKIPYHIHARIIDQLKDSFYDASCTTESSERNLKSIVANYETGLMARQMLDLGIAKSDIDKWHHEIYDTKKRRRRTVYHKLSYHGQYLSFPYKIYKRRWYEDDYIRIALMYVKAGLYGFFSGPWAAAQSIIVDMATISGACERYGIDPLHLNIALTLSKMGWNYWQVQGMPEPPARPNYRGADRVKVRIGSSMCKAPGYKQAGFEHSQTEIGGKVYEHGKIIQNIEKGNGTWRVGNRVLMEFYVSPADAQKMIAAMKNVNNIPLTSLNLYGLEGVCHHVTEAGLKAVGRSLISNPPNGYFTGMAVFGN